MPLAKSATAELMEEHAVPVVELVTDREGGARVSDGGGGAFWTGCCSALTIRGLVCIARPFVGGVVILTGDGAVDFNAEVVGGAAGCAARAGG